MDELIERLNSMEKQLHFITATLDKSNLISGDLSDIKELSALDYFGYDENRITGDLSLLKELEKVDYINMVTLWSKCKGENDALVGGYIPEKGHIPSVGDTVLTNCRIVEITDGHIYVKEIK